jgi:PAS domain S-box-containing protein
MEADKKRKRDSDFAEYMIRTSLFSMKYGLFATFWLFLVFAIINMFFFPGNVEQEFFIRFGIIMPYVLLSLMVLYFKVFWKHLEAYLTVINLMVGVSVFLIGAFADFTDPGYGYFVNWTMLVIMGTAAFYRIRFTNFLMVGLTLLTAYALSNVVNGFYAADPFAFMNNLFFVVAISSIGYFVAWNMYQLNRNNFIHQKALEKNYNELLGEMRVRTEAEKNLDHSQQQYMNMLDTIPDSILVLNREMRIQAANAQAKRINHHLGLPTDMIGKKMEKVYPFLSPETIGETERVFTEGQVMLTTQHANLGGKHYITETRKVPIVKDDRVDQVMLIIRDVTREKEYEDMKLKNAEQKELLLREIHHRVKNNLAIVISMLSLQARSNPDPMLTGIIQDIELRIRSMALIHEHLYRSENLDRIPLAEYLKSLSAVISSTFQRPNIKFHNDLETMDSNIEAALPVGLIANELLTNAFKYAFPDGAGGNITLRLRQLEGERIEMTVTDDGIGLPEHFSVAEQPTLGMFMVRLLIEQLYGKLEIDTAKGTTFRIIFNQKLI